MPKPDLPAVPAIDVTIEPEVQMAIDQKTKPLGALGQLETLARQIAMVQQTTSPLANGCELVIFAADHGIAASGVSAYPAEVTRQMVANFLAGGAAANVFSTQMDVDLQIVDAGVAGPPIEHPALISKRMGDGTKNFLTEPAMSEGEVCEALEAGAQLGRAAKYQFMAFGEMGIGNTSSAALIANKLAGLPLDKLVGRGTGLDDSALAAKLRTLEAASQRVTQPLSPVKCLQEYGGFEIAMMTGAMIGAAAAGRCILIDGYIATAAYLAAAGIEPKIKAHAIFCHTSAESGHAAMLQGIPAQPILDLNLRLGEGTGTLLAWPMIRCAVHMLTDMASFQAAGVSTAT